MAKKMKMLITLGIAIMMLFAIAGLAACELNNPTLAEYQATAITALEDYATSKGQRNYTSENWLVLQCHVATGRTAINEAIDKAGVRFARDAAKAAVRTVERSSLFGFEAQICRVYTDREMHFDNPRIATINDVAELLLWNEESLQYRNNEWQEFFAANLLVFEEGFFSNSQLILVEFWGGDLDYEVLDINYYSGTLVVNLEREPVCSKLDQTLLAVNRLLILEIPRITTNFNIEFVLA